MDYYEIWCDLKPGVKDLDFCEDVRAYMLHLQDSGLIAGFRLARRKLGFGPPDLGEFNITIETNDLAQLEQAFQDVRRRSGTTERLHAKVYSAVENLTFALYRDFPDREC